MDTQTATAVKNVVEALHLPKVYSATKYISESLVVRASSVRYDGKLKKKGANLQAVLVIGRPNYAQRKFIASCKKAGEPFPVKKVQLKMVK